MVALVRMLGRGSVEAAGRVWEPAANRRSALLYYLAYARGWVPREDLLVLFWPDADEHRARTNLRQLLMSVRALPFAAGLEVEPTRARWLVATDLDRADRAWADGDPVALRDDWALPLLDGFRLNAAPEFESWLELERMLRVEHVRASVCELARRWRSEDRVDEAVGLLDRWLRADPTHEEAFRLWVEASVRAGQRTAVLARYEALATRLATAFGVEPEPSTTDLVARSCAAIVAGAPASPDPVPAPPSDRSDASRLGAFVGREPELARLQQLLVPGAVVAVVGVGGMGKTRLAFESAKRTGTGFADGVVRAELHVAQDADGVASVLAKAIGLDLAHRTPSIDEVATALAGRQVLVVMDNVEQIAQLEDVLAVWRERAPEVAWLVTSRRSLALGDVVTLELGGLPYRASADDAPVDTSLPAVRLLVERARRIGVELDVERDRDDLARVARATAGMPLALELAAGWLRVMSIGAVADELARGIDLLHATEDRAHGRHVSVRTVFEASWSALTPAERAALVALAAFRGGFTEAAARAVADVGRPMLLALRNKSFVSLGARGRFVQHPLLEAYVRDHAATDPAFAAARERHADWVFAHLETEERRGQRGAAASALAAVAAELPNVEAAWDYLIEIGRPPRLHVGGATLVNAFRQAGRTERYDELVRSARRVAAAGSAAWAWACLHGWSRAADRFGRDEEDFEEVAVALETLQRAERDPYWLAWGSIVYAYSALGTGRRAAGRSALTEAAERFAALEDWDLVGEVRATEYLLAGDPDERRQTFEEIEALARRTGNTDLAVRGKRMHARYVGTTFGEWGTALRLVEEVLAIERGRSAPPSRLVDPLLGAAGLTAAIGDLDAAEAYAAEAHALAARLPPGGRAVLATALAERARIAWLRGEGVRARSLLDGSPGTRGQDVRTEVLRARLALDAGDWPHARVCVERAAADVVGHLDRRASTLNAVDLQVLRAEIALAAGERDSARATLAEAIEVALATMLVPVLLDAVAAAAPLLPEELGDALRSWVATQPAAEYAARRRCTDHRPRASGSRPALDGVDAPAVAKRVLGALRTERGEAEPAPRA